MPRRRVSEWRGSVALAVYHGAISLLLLILWPVVVWRLAFNRRLRDALFSRLSSPEAGSGDRPVVWVHGVSVGEVKGLATLVAAIERAHPEVEIVVSSSTPTGFDLAHRLYPGRRVIRYPLDLFHLPGRALDRIRPRCILLMELEIWPNFLQSARRRGVPVAVVNGRISERSYRGYRRVRMFLPQFDWVTRFCVQNAAYRDRLLALGVDDDRIAVTGNVKYDGVLLGRQPTDADRVRTWLAADGRDVLVAGSTHGREEEWVAGIARALARERGRPLRLVVVPRHPERAPVVCDAVRSVGGRPARWSERQESFRVLGDADIVVVDTIGHLETFYAACDVAFVGGSLVPHGGQNMLEPAALGKAVVFGPHTANFRNDVELLLGADAAIQVADVEALREVIGALLQDPSRRAALGERAVALIRENQGAAERTRQLLDPLLAGNASATA